MKYFAVIFSIALLASCASRGPAEYKTWEEADQHTHRPELMNRSQ